MNSPDLSRDSAVDKAFRDMSLVQRHVKGKEHLAAAADHVNRGEGGLVVLPNHLSMLDILVFKEVREVLNPEVLMAAFWANKFTGADVGKYEDEDLDATRKFGEIGEGLAKKAGITLLSVPQEVSMNDRELMREGLKIIERGRQIVQEENGVLGFFPEGTRSRNGGFSEAKEAAVNKVTKEGGDRLWILPVGIMGSQKILPVNGKPNKLAAVLLGIKMIFTKPITAERFREDANERGWTPGVEAMFRIAQVLPRKMWGVYLTRFSQILSKK